MKKMMKMIALAIAVMGLLAGCAEDAGAVPVVLVQQLLQAGTVEDKFAGIVVSENAVEIQRDVDKTIKELYVAEGDEVRANQKLFSYDSDELSLTLDKQELELDRLEAEISDLKKQISEQEKAIKKETNATTKATLELGLRQMQTELTQAQYDKSAMQTEIKYTKDMLKDVDVRSPIDGTIRQIDENGTNYITIQQSGAYQVQGLLNELNLNAGIMEGTPVTVISRLDSDVTWSGVVTLVDYNTTETNGYDSLYGSTDTMSSSTSYPFYITLEHTDGLLLGQHVYIQVNMGSALDPNGVYVPESYLMDLGYDGETGLETASVWTVDGEGKLTRRDLVLGGYDMSTGSYAIAEGLGLFDYVADPSNPACAEGARADLRDMAGYQGLDGETEPSESLDSQSTGTAGSEE